MRRAWSRLGLRGRLTLSIAAIVIAAFAVLFVAVRQQMSNESTLIRAHERREASGKTATGADRGETRSLAPIEDAQSDVVKTFVLFGGLSLAAALLAGYLVAARTAAPLRRMAGTAAAVDAGDLKPRIGAEPTAAVEVRTLADGFDHMLDRLEAAFSRQRRFVADASHELRTPLTAIRGQLEVLARQQQPDGAEVRRVEGLVMREMERLERLVDDLLALASLEEAERPQLRPVAVPPPARAGCRRRCDAGRDRRRDRRRRPGPTATGRHQPAGQRPPPRRAGGSGRALGHRCRQGAADRRRR